MKKLNNKGFTLIELLAVVVILAIVMGIAGTSVLNSINNSRTSSLYSAAQTAANNLNTWISEDMLVTDNTKKKLGDNFVTYTQGTNANKWICLGDNNTNFKIMNASGSSASTTLLDALSLSGSDLTTTGTAMTNSASTAPTIGRTCSAVRYNTKTGSYEVLFVAKQNGKYWVSNNGTSGANNYAFSRATKSGETITD